MNSTYYPLGFGILISLARRKTSRAEVNSEKLEMGWKCCSNSLYHHTSNEMSPSNNGNQDLDTSEERPTFPRSKWDVLFW